MEPNTAAGLRRFPTGQNLNPEADEILDVAGRYGEAVHRAVAPIRPSIAASGVPRCCIRTDSIASDRRRPA